MQVELSPVTSRITQDMINHYAVVSDDFNPIHVDPEFARGSPMGGIIAHGTLSVNLIWQSLGKTFPELSWGGVGIEVRFMRPVRVGDSITVTGGLNAELGYDVKICNQNGETVIAGKVKLPPRTITGEA